MDGINRVKLARYHNRRGVRMLQCARGTELSTHAEQFRKLARASFKCARFQMQTLRSLAGMAKLRGYWVTECGQKSVLVYAGSPDEAVGVAACSGDWYGDAIDSATIEPSVRPMTHIKPSVIAWASDMDLVV